MRLRRVGPTNGGAAARDGWIFILLLALLVWLPVPWGSKPPLAASFFALLAALLVTIHAAVLARSPAPLPSLPPASRIAMLLWAGWCAWIALQLVPLPASVLAVLKPAGFSAHAALGRLPGASPLYTWSILPGATVDQLLLTLGYLCVFWLTLAMVIHNRPRQRWLLTALTLSGLAQALYGIVMTLSGFELGFMGPKTTNIGFTTGTFVNKNHLAGYLELALSAGTALVLIDLRPKPLRNWRQALDSIVELGLSGRLRTRVMLAIMVIALVLTRSRMGNIAFFSSLAAFGGLYMLLRHRPYFPRALLLFVSIFVVDLWIVSDRYGLHQVAQRIEQTELERETRAEVFADLMPVVRAYGIAGSGLGTFASAYSPYRTADITVYYDHAHNDHLEFVIETGVIGYAFLLALGALVLVHGLKTIRQRHDPMACAIGFAGPMALTCITIHGFADFNLRIPAVAATLVALMALTLSCSSEPHDNHAPPEPGETRPA